MSEREEMIEDLSGTVDFEDKLPNIREDFEKWYNLEYPNSSLERSVFHGDGYKAIGAYIGMGDSWVRKYFITNNIFISRR